MSNIFSYEFEELPLVMHGDIPAGLINGCAEIKYNRAGCWDIQSVSIEGYQTLTPTERERGVKPWVYVKAPVELALMIYERLYGTMWSAKVQDAVNEQLESDREDAADERADMRRDERMGL